MKDVKIYENASVLIEDGHIVAVGDGAEWAKTVPVDKQIDATGKTVLPRFRRFAYTLCVRRLPC